MSPTQNLIPRHDHTALRRPPTPVRRAGSGDRRRIEVAAGIGLVAAVGRVRLPARAGVRRGRPAGGVAAGRVPDPGSAPTPADAAGSRHGLVRPSLARQAPGRRGPGRAPGIDGGHVSWAAAGTAGTPTTAGRRCSCSSSWPRTYLATRRLLLTVLIGAVDRRGRVLGLGPEPGRHPQRRPHGPRRTSTSKPAGAGWPATTTSPSPRSTWTRPSRCGWPASAPTTRPRWRSGR